ncbi:MAG TPA: family 43 glycosylhydrolase [Cyclobacteriaceae bacterium]
MKQTQTLLSTSPVARRTVFFSFLMIMLLAFTVKAQPPSHDPSTMATSGGRYWIFTTGDGVWCMSSSNTDFTDWRAETTPFTKTSWPSWITTYVPSFAGTFWAPEVVYVNSQYRLYYSCSTFGSKNSCIGLATASSLTGPWTDQGVVVYSNSSTSENAIDPAIYAGSYLVYGSFFGGIRLAEISSTGKTRNSTRYALASGDCEAPYILKNGSYYYLFINRGACCKGVNSTTYRIQVGRSTSITGPYLDKNGVDLNSGGGTNLVVTTGRYIGPGHFGYGQGKVTYHFYDGNDSGNAKLRITTLSWSNGWPVVSGGGARMATEEEMSGEKIQAELSEIVSSFPNPVKENILTIQTGLPVKADVAIELINESGKVVHHDKLGLREVGMLTHEINVSSFTKGFYIVSLVKTDVQGVTKKVTQKVIIQ